MRKKAFERWSIFDYNIKLTEILAEHLEKISSDAIIGNISEEETTKYIKKCIKY